MEKLLATMYATIYDDIYSGSGVYNTLTTYSKAIAGSLEKGGSLYNAYLYVRTIALGILIVYFVITVGTRFQGREISMSIFFKSLLEFFIGFAFTLVSFDLVVLFFKLGDELAAMILESSADMTGLGKYIDNLAGSVSTIDFTAQVIYIFKALFQYLACLIVDFVIIYAVVTRVLRICVNAVMSPIAVCNFFDDSRRSEGIRFIKKTFAMCLQCSMIMIICASATSLARYMASDKDSRFYKDMASETDVVSAKEDMVNSKSVSLDAISGAMGEAQAESGYADLDPEGHAENNYYEAWKQIKKNYAKVTTSDEEEYKKYEELLRIRVFKRNIKNSNHFDYNKKGYAKIRDEYNIFDIDKVTTFLDLILKGNSWITIVIVSFMKAGLIKKSNSLCNVIVGL